MKMKIRLNMMNIFHYIHQKLKKIIFNDFKIISKIKDLLFLSFKTKKIYLIIHLKIKIHKIKKFKK